MAYWTPEMKQESRDLATAVIATARHMNKADREVAKRLGVTRAAVCNWRGGVHGLGTKRVVALAREFITEGGFVPIPPTPNLGDGVNNGRNSEAMRRSHAKRRAALRASMKADLLRPFRGTVAPVVSAHRAPAPAAGGKPDESPIPAAAIVLHQSARRMPVAEWFGLFRALATAKV